MQLHSSAYHLLALIQTCVFAIALMLWLLITGGNALSSHGVVSHPNIQLLLWCPCAHLQLP
jgi:hypothetical protein